MGARAWGLVRDIDTPADLGLTWTHEDPRPEETEVVVASREG